jgi:hypothetical protein
MTPDPAVRVFAWYPVWPQLIGQALLGVMLFASGLGLVVFAGLLWDAGDWWVIPAVLMLIPGALLMFYGGGLFIVWVFLVLCCSRLAMIASVNRDGVRIYESPRCDLFQKSVFVSFASVVQVRRERTGRKRDCLRIVHGPEYRTETVEEIRPADLDALLAVLAARCPATFAPAPSTSSVSPRSADDDV